MTRRIPGSLLLAAALFACSPTPPAPAAPAPPAERLHAILATPITAAQDSAYDAFVAERGIAAVERGLKALAVDSAADALARANAVLRLRDIPSFAFDVFNRTSLDPDARVRGATMAAAGRLLPYSRGEAVALLARGLVDRELGIQAKALQELRDGDLELLRFYIASDPPAELRDIAVQALRNALALGAPLEPEADGTLRRIAPAGVEVVLRPDTVHAEFDQVIGTLSVVGAGGAERVVADSVEAVATIIPAVVDPSGRHVAVEAARRIEVHDLETGSVRVIGSGIAPRPLPLTPDFFYFREIDRQLVIGGTRLAYELVRVPFDAGEAAAIDTVEVTARPDRRGYLSPLRWSRIRDSGTRFVLTTDGLEQHDLPLLLQRAPADD